jgi:hypothetical protein
VCAGLLYLLIAVGIVQSFRLRVLDAWCVLGCCTSLIAVGIVQSFRLRVLDAWCVLGCCTSYLRRGQRKPVGTVQENVGVAVDECPFHIAIIMRAVGTTALCLILRRALYVRQSFPSYCCGERLLANLDYRTPAREPRIRAL